MTEKSTNRTICRT